MPLVRIVAAGIAFALLFENVSTDCIGTVSRNEWGGPRPKRVEYIIFPVPNVVIMHTATPECLTENACTKRVQNIMTYYLNTLRYHDMGYNFLVGGDGRIYDGAGWHKMGAHTKGYNHKSIGIAFIGNFQEKLPNEKQLSAAKDLLDCGVAIGELEIDYKLIGAKQVRPTESPGEKLFQEIKTWPHFGKP